MSSRHTDWGHGDPAWAADPFAIWADLREQCPVARFRMTDPTATTWILGHLRGPHAVDIEILEGY